MSWVYLQIRPDTPRFLTLFAYSLPFPHLLRVWDNFLCRGIKSWTPSHSVGSLCFSPRRIDRSIYLFVHKHIWYWRNSLSSDWKRKWCPKLLWHLWAYDIFGRHEAWAVAWSFHKALILQPHPESTFAKTAKIKCNTVFCRKNMFIHFHFLCIERLQGCNGFIRVAKQLLSTDTYIPADTLHPVHVVHRILVSGLGYNVLLHCAMSLLLLWSTSDSTSHAIPRHEIAATQTLQEPVVGYSWTGVGMYCKSLETWVVQNRGCTWPMLV